MYVGRPGEEWPLLRRRSCRFLLSVSWFFADVSIGSNFPLTSALFCASKPTRLHKHSPHVFVLINAVHRALLKRCVICVETPHPSGRHVHQEVPQSRVQLSDACVTCVLSLDHVVHRPRGKVTRRMLFFRAERHTRTHTHTHTHDHPNSISSPDCLEMVLLEMTRFLQQNQSRGLFQLWIYSARLSSIDFAPLIYTEKSAYFEQAANRL